MRKNTFFLVSQSQIKLFLGLTLSPIINNKAKWTKLPNCFQNTKERNPGLKKISNGKFVQQQFFFIKIIALRDIELLKSPKSRSETKKIKTQKEENVRRRKFEFFLFQSPEIAAVRAIAKHWLAERSLKVSVWLQHCFSEEVLPVRGDEYFAIMSNESLKLSSAEMAKKVEEFQEWINNEPDLPRNIGKIAKMQKWSECSCFDLPSEKHLLLRYLKTYNFNVEKAQTLLKFSFGLRQKNKIIFTNRDFMSPEIQKVLNYW